MRKDRLRKRRKGRVWRPSSLLFLGGLRIGVELKNAALELGGLIAESGGVECMGNYPKGFGTTRSGVNHLRVTAGQRGIHAIANEEDREDPGRDGMLRRNICRGKSGKSLAPGEHHPRAWSEESLSKPRVLLKAGVVVGRFAEAGERRFRHDRFDARIDACGLQGDARSHRFSQRIDMNRMFGGNEGVQDGTGVVAFKPAVGGNRSFAFAVGARVHEGDAIAGAEEDEGRLEDAHAVIGDPVEK